MDRWSIERVLVIKCVAPSEGKVLEIAITSRRWDDADSSGTQVRVEPIGLQGTSYHVRVTCRHEGASWTLQFIRGYLYCVLETHRESLPVVVTLKNIL